MSKYETPYRHILYQKAKKSDDIEWTVYHMEYVGPNRMMVWSAVREGVAPNMDEAEKEAVATPRDLIPGCLSLN